MTRIFAYWNSCGKTEVEYEYTLQMTTITNYIQNSYQNCSVSDWKSPGENFPILPTLTSDYCSYLTVQPNVVFCLVCCAFWDVLLLFHPQNCCSLHIFVFRCYHVFRRSFKKSGYILLSNHSVTTSSQLEEWGMNTPWMGCQSNSACTYIFTHYIQACMFLGGGS